MRAPPLAINDLEPPDCFSYALNSVNLTMPIASPNTYAKQPVPSRLDNRHPFSVWSLSLLPMPVLPRVAYFTHTNDTGHVQCAPHVAPVPIAMTSIGITVPADAVLAESFRPDVCRGNP